MNGVTTALFVLAHQDDEYGCAPQIRSIVQSGGRAVIFYLTDGSTPAFSADVRTAESMAVLTSLGVASENVHVLGTALGIGGEELTEHIDSAYARLAEVARPFAGTGGLRIYALAWEGGHPDHDAAHLAAARLARDMGIPHIFEFALYNGYRRPGRLFRVLSFCDEQPVGDAAGPRLPLRDAIRYGMLCWRYPSQRKTWAGLFPGGFARFVVRRRSAVRAVRSDRALGRPHEGPLYYERRWGMRYEHFARLTERFLVVERAGQAR
jgi:LmbE family N-acetylglucosaminyl deacetylase